MLQNIFFTSLWLANALSLPDYVALISGSIALRCFAFCVGTPAELMVCPNLDE